MGDATQVIVDVDVIKTHELIVIKIARGLNQDKVQTFSKSKKKNKYWHVHIKSMPRHVGINCMPRAHQLQHSIKTYSTNTLALQRVR